jgi:hypothetical protein
MIILHYILSCCVVNASNNFSQHLPTAPNSMGARDVELHTHIPLTQRLEMSGAMLPLLQNPLRRAEGNVLFPLLSRHTNSTSPLIR